MSVHSLLLIGADKLFEENGIDKIRTLQVQIQDEIEKKREELRTLVGERYRDLLKAADTITEMKYSTDSVINGIHRTECLCRALQQKKFTGLDDVDTKTRSTDDVGDVAKIVEIKVLLSLPEQIWIAIDNRNYLLGAELFLFATHIQFGINVLPNSKEIKEEYPVVCKQWEVITSYRNIIISGAENQLGLTDISYEESAECLSSIILLEGVTHDNLLSRYLNLRFAKLQHILHYDDVARNKLKLLILLLQTTLSTICHCFIVTDPSGGKCLVDRKVESVTGNETKPTLSKLGQITSLPDHYLSHMIRNFRPSIKKGVEALSREAIQRKVQDWLRLVDCFLKVELTKLLMLINEVERLHKIIKEDVHNVRYPRDWSATVTALLSVSDLNIYETYMKDIVTKRVTDIIESAWRDCIDGIMAQLKEVDEEISKERGKQMENDIRWYVWRENIMDTHEALGLKTQGYTHRVKTLSDSVEASIKHLLDAVELYVGVSLPESNMEVRSDAAHVRLFLNRCSFDMLLRLSRSVSGSCKQGGSPITESGIIVRARFLQSLIVQSPSLEKCLRQGQRQALKELPDNDMLNAWAESCIFLNEESSRIWQLWKELTIAKLRNLIKTRLSVKISLRTLLTSKALNEMINIEEQTEDGERIQSDIRVPSQPSLPLQELLFDACQLLNSVIPHTLPRKIHQDLVEKFVEMILEHYEEWSQCEMIYQSQAWQMLLDVRFISLLLITQENKATSEAISEGLEKMIDPFDLDVHYPYLQNSVKKSAQRLQSTVGVLINFREKLPVLNGLKLTSDGAASAKVEEPNVLAMSDKIPWFALLAVASQSYEASSASKESTPEKIGKTKEKELRKESKSRDFVRSANAFLNAMTSRWS